MLTETIDTVDVTDWKVWLPLILIVVAIPLIRWLISMASVQKITQNSQMLYLAKSVVESVINEVEKSSKQKVEAAGGKKALAVALVKEGIEKAGIKTNLFTDAVISGLIEQAVNWEFNKDKK